MDQASDSHYRYAYHLQSGHKMALGPTIVTVLLQIFFMILTVKQF